MNAVQKVATGNAFEPNYSAVAGQDFRFGASDRLLHFTLVSTDEHLGADRILGVEFVALTGVFQWTRFAGCLASVVATVPKWTSSAFRASFHLIVLLLLGVWGSLRNEPLPLPSRLEL